MWSQLTLGYLWATRAYQLLTLTLPCTTTTLYTTIHSVIVKTLTLRSQVTSLSYLRVLVTSVVSTQTCCMFTAHWMMYVKVVLYVYTRGHPGREHVKEPSRPAASLPASFYEANSHHTAHSIYSVSDWCCIILIWKIRLYIVTNRLKIRTNIIASVVKESPVDI